MEMKTQGPTFAELWAKAAWAPIPNCPGRYKLVSDERTASLATLVGDGVDIERHCLPGVRDTVFIARFADGGMISYGRADGTWLHTLNTKTGFERKLAQLGIPPEPVNHA